MACKCLGRVYIFPFGWRGEWGFGEDCLWSPEEGVRSGEWGGTNQPKAFGCQGWGLQSTSQKEKQGKRVATSLMRQNCQPEAESLGMSMGVAGI
jgi:hypothetical protein